MPSAIRAVAEYDKVHFLQYYILILFLGTPTKHKEYLNQPSAVLNPCSKCRAFTSNITSSTIKIQHSL